MNPTLECNRLTKRFGSLAALEDVDLSIMPGRGVGLLGPNGSGKTTLIKLANGLLTPNSGEIKICGMAPGKETKAHSAFFTVTPPSAIMPAAAIRNRMSFRFCISVPRNKKNCKTSSRDSG